LTDSKLHCSPCSLQIISGCSKGHVSSCWDGNAALLNASTTCSHQIRHYPSTAAKDSPCVSVIVLIYLPHLGTGELHIVERIDALGSLPSPPASSTSSLLLSGRSTVLLQHFFISCPGDLVLIWEAIWWSIFYLRRRSIYEL
jgi:hypothetical protein